VLRVTRKIPFCCATPSPSDKKKRRKKPPGAARVINSNLFNDSSHIARACHSEARLGLGWIEDACLSRRHDGWAEVVGSDVNRSRGDVVDVASDLSIAALGEFDVTAGRRRIANRAVLDWTSEESASGIVAWNFAHR
jgi:hypothetical protein